MNNASIVKRLLVPALAALLLLPATTYAAADVVPIGDVSFNVNQSLSDNLRRLSGKRIRVTLNSGIQLTGTVRDIGNDLVHLEKIENRDFFDALIRIDSINAIDTRFRKVLR